MTLLDYILPPLIGAAIGYMTNSIAIAMLFKPYKAWKVLGLKVPFTPGVIPRHREELARNIGNMVGNLLLNEETLGKQLTSPHTQGILNKMIQNNLDRLMDYDFPPIAKLVPKAFSDIFHSSYQSLKDVLKNIWHDFLLGPSIEPLIRSLVDSNIDSLSEKSLKDLMKQKDAEQWIKKTVSNILNEIIEQHSLKEWLESNLDRFKTNTTHLEDYIPQELLDLLIHWVKKELPNFLDQMEKSIFDSKLDQKLFVNFKEFIFSYLETLNAAQRFFVNVWGVEERVEEDLPVVIQQAIQQIFSNLRSEETQNKTLEALRISLNRLMEKAIGELINDMDESDYDQLKEQIVAKIQDYFHDQNKQDKLADSITQVYNRFKDKPIKEILGYTNLSNDSVKNSINNWLVKTLQKEDVRNAIYQHLETKLDDFVFHKPIGPLNQLITIESQNKDKISSYIGQQLINLIHKDIGQIVEAVNLKKVVIDKINLFPLEKLEGLLQSIIRKHLKWINIFGAILGLIIGSLQIIF
ncbi:MAG TPA: DUF445 family protein [Spirochaetes bacterium]|nr:DUF445 family protein [Spirochaetota bacterium]